MRNQAAFQLTKADCQMKREWPLTHFGLKNQKWVIMISSRYSFSAGEIFADLTLADQQAVVGCVAHKEYFHFLAWHNIAEMPKTVAN